MVLPDPDRPTTAINSPLGTSKFTALTAVTAVSPLPKTLLKSSADIMLSGRGLESRSPIMTPGSPFDNYPGWGVAGRQPA